MSKICKERVQGNEKMNLSCVLGHSILHYFCVLGIPYDHLYSAPCLACWALFGSLAPAMCNRTSCVQVHELPQSQVDR